MHNRLSITMILISGLFSSNNIFCQSPVRSAMSHSISYLDDIYGYDVQKYEINIDITDTLTQNVTADLKMQAKVEESGLNKITVDFAKKSTIVLDSIILNSFGIDNYSFDPQTVNWQNGRLNLNLPVSLSAGDLFSLKIVYHGRDFNYTYPGGWQQGLIFGSHNNHSLIKTYSQKEFAHYWFPCKDLPADKALVDLKITCWNHQTAAANGKLADIIILNDNKRKFHWIESYPVATYLIAFSVSNYRIYEQNYTSQDGTVQMPITNYIFPEFYSNAVDSLAVIPDALSFFAQKFGEYPFIQEKYGHAMYDLIGGQEHQTITAFDQNTNETTLVHELIHQWFGDFITYRDWKDLWFNEGAACFYEAVWQEHLHGTEAYFQSLNQFRDMLSFNTPLYTDDTQGNEYFKAKWIFHMLRYLLGDTGFNDFLHKFLTESPFIHGSVSTEEFFSYLQNETGRDFSSFKEQWIYKAGFPKFRYAFQIASNSHQLNLQLKQIQPLSDLVPLFSVPVPLQVKFTDNSDTVVVLNSSMQSESYQFNFSRQITDSISLKQFNYQDKILCTKIVAPFVSIDQEPILKINNLEQNYPNPFNPQTVISYELTAAASVTLSIYNSTGAIIKEQNLSNVAPGRHKFIFDGVNLNSGIYFYTLQINGKSAGAAKKMLLLR